MSIISKKSNKFSHDIIFSAKIVILNFLFVLLGAIMEYLDLVELINEKPSYLEAGVKLGDFGAVVSEKSINGQWQVIFSEFYTGKDIADILVSEEDLKIYDGMPKNKYPKPRNV